MSGCRLEYHRSSYKVGGIRVDTSQELVPQRSHHLEHRTPAHRGHSPAPPASCRPQHGRDPPTLPAPRRLHRDRRGGASQCTQLDTDERGGIDADHGREREGLHVFSEPLEGFSLQSVPRFTQKILSMDFTVFKTKNSDAG
jgi:hypothetical protein